MDRRRFVSAIPVAVGTGSIAVAEAYAQTASGSDTAARSDEVAIASIVTGERWARDMAQWDVMQAAYHPGATVDISWITGPAAEFVAQSKQHYERGTRSLHLLGPVLVKVNGDRATADAGAQILIPGSIRGVECMTQSYCRIVERLERRGGRWGIVLLESIYQMETIVPANPAQTLKIDPAKLASYRASYRFMSYVQEERGTKMRDDLPGIDRPEAIAQLYSRNTAWLKGVA
jgi:hypothetical protein